MKVRQLGNIKMIEFDNMEDAVAYATNTYVKPTVDHALLAMLAQAETFGLISAN